MGMTWRVQVPGGDEKVIRAEMETVLERWEQAVSVWREDSELARFNRGPAGEWVAVGEEIAAAVRLSWELAEETEGALDITVGPLVELWGFGRTGRRTTAPSTAEIEQVKQRCGWRYLEWDETRRALRKRRADLELNLNAVVEGLVLEEVRRRLEALGFADFLIELGGELLARGTSADGGPWQVAIQAPTGGSGELFSLMPLMDAALATSGTYRQRVGSLEGGYCHLIDPQTGRPVAHRLASVSVLDEEAGRADGLATALLILGPERGRKVAERLGVRVFWIESAD